MLTERNLFTDTVFKSYVHPWCKVRRVLWSDLDLSLLLQLRCFASQER